MLNDETVKKVIKHIGVKGFLDWLPDKMFIKLMFWALLGRKLNLEKPTTYNEKLQWLKLYDHREIYSTFVDKFEAKKYVGSVIGEEHIIPTYGVWESFEEIDFSKLPNQFVLKCTHDCGGLVICKDKNSFDIDSARKKISACMKKNYYKKWREWPYSNVKPRIIAEEYMEDSITHDLRDYKFFSFDGKTEFCFIATDRQTEGEETKFDFYDSNFVRLDIKNGHPNSSLVLEKPDNYDDMLKFANMLSKGYPHIRVDFYDINGKIYFGELTLYHFGGFVNFEPEDWDYTFGKFIKLPEKR